MDGRKAQGLPITVIIIAALALIVLVVLMIIFTGGIGRFGRQIGTCPFECKTVAECSEPGDISLGGDYKQPDDPKKTCKDDNKICCRKAVEP